MDFHMMVLHDSFNGVEDTYSEEATDVIQSLPFITNTPVYDWLVSNFIKSYPIEPIQEYGSDKFCSCIRPCETRYCICRRLNKPCGPKCRCNVMCCKNRTFNKRGTDERISCRCRKRKCDTKYCECRRRGVDCSIHCVCGDGCTNCLEEDDIKLIAEL